MTGTQLILGIVSCGVTLGAVFGLIGYVLYRLALPKLSALSKLT